MLEHKEKTKSVFDGTIIDIETIGSFNSTYFDSRRYSEIVPVIFGCIDSNGLEIYCAKNSESVQKLKEKIPAILEKLEKPFHAFNTDFERAVFFHSLDLEVQFEKELNREKYEAKRNTVCELKIPQYGDPFNDNGLLCMQSWLTGQKEGIERAIAHNRSCLLKERDILLKRGARKPDKLEFIKI